VGNLPIDIRESEVEDLMKKYGRILQIDLKIPARPPAFAFVEFEDYRDAEDACRAKDGTEFDGSRIRVEIARGRRGGPGGDDRGGDRYGDRGGDRYGDRGGYGDRGRGGYGDRPRGGPREGDIPLNSKTGYRVFVKNVPESCSWQDLKDHFRVVGNPAFTNVYRTGRDKCCGVVEFDNRDDMERAVKDLDDSEFKNRYDKTRVQVLEDKGNVDELVYGRGGGGGGRSRSRSPRRSRSRSPRRSRSRSNRRSRSRSRSPAGGRRSRSPSPRGRSPSPRRSRSPSPRARSPSPRRSRSPSPRAD